MYSWRHFYLPPLPPWHTWCSPQVYPSHQKADGHREGGRHRRNKILREKQSPCTQAWKCWHSPYPTTSPLCAPLAPGLWAAEIHPALPTLKYYFVSSPSASVYTRVLPSLQKVSAIPLPSPSDTGTARNLQKDRQDHTPGPAVQKKKLFSPSTARPDPAV